MKAMACVVGVLILAAGWPFVLRSVRPRPVECLVEPEGRQVILSSRRGGNESVFYRLRNLCDARFHLSIQGKSCASVGVELEKADIEPFGTVDVRISVHVPSTGANSGSVVLWAAPSLDGKARPTSITLEFDVHADHDIAFYTVPAELPVDVGDINNTRTLTLHCRHSGQPAVMGVIGGHEPSPIILRELVPWKECAPGEYATVAEIQIKKTLIDSLPMDVELGLSTTSGATLRAVLHFVEKKANKYVR